jgi:hypothetical protein
VIDKVFNKNGDIKKTWSKEKFELLGRPGISERAIQLINEFNEEYGKEGHYKEVTKLLGNMYVLFKIAQEDSYWREQTFKGVIKEIDELEEIEKK